MDLTTFAAVLGFVAGAVALPIWPACGGGLRRAVAPVLRFLTARPAYPSTYPTKGHRHVHEHRASRPTGRSSARPAQSRTEGPQRRPTNANGPAQRAAGPDGLESGSRQHNDRHDGGNHPRVMTAATDTSRPNDQTERDSP